MPSWAPNPDEIVRLATQLACLAAAGSLFAWIFRNAGVWGGRPGAALLAGVMAGLLLGPSVAGRAWPEWHAPTFDGAAPERRAIAALERRHGADLTVWRAAGSDPQAGASLRRRHDWERAAAASALASAERRHERLFGAACAVLAAAVFSAALWAARPRRGPDGAVTPARIALVGAAAVAGEAALGAVLATLLGGLPWHIGAAIGAAGACGTAFAGLPLRWVPVAGRTRGASRLGLAMLAGAAGVMAVSGSERQRLLLLGCAGLVAVALLARRVAVPDQRLRAAIRAGITTLAVPTLVAAAASRIDVPLIASDWRPLALAAAVAALSGNVAFAVQWLALKVRWAGEPRPAAPRLVGLYHAGFCVTGACAVPALAGLTGLDPSGAAASACIAGLLVSAVAGELVLGTTLHAMARPAAGDAEVS